MRAWSRPLFAALALAALALAADRVRLDLPAGDGLAPLVDLTLRGVQMVTGLTPDLAAGLLGLAAVTMATALLAPRWDALALALPGLALGVATGPGEALLCLCGLGLARAMLRLTAEQDLSALIGTGLALGLMPLVHPAGIAFALSALPLLASSLPAPLIAGRAATGTFLILGVPALGLPLGFGLLAWRHALPVFRLGGAADDLAIVTLLPRLIPGLVLAALALLPLGAGSSRRRLTTGALIALPPIAMLLHGIGGGEVFAAAALAPSFTLAGLMEARSPWPRFCLIAFVVALAIWGWSCALP